jgi:NAD(P)-dependent dehydrogenase (short-subunit alcohol dehydrogenase family)
MVNLQDKVALVTGGTSGIGRAAAVQLAQAGAKVVVTGRREAEGQQTLKLIQQAGGTGEFVQGDVSQEAAVKKLVDDIVSKYGKLDIAFNNAGVDEPFSNLHEETAEMYDHVFNINVKGLWLSMKYEIAAMLKTGGGSIINNSSIAGLIGFGPVPIYTASKHAVSGFTRAAALAYAKQGIRVNAVAPGAIQTDMITRMAGDEDSEMKKMMISMHPIGRLGKPHEIADAVLFLASDESSFITGHVMPVDGGFTAA